MTGDTALYGVGGYLWPSFVKSNHRLGENSQGLEVPEYLDRFPIDNLSTDDRTDDFQSRFLPFYRLCQIFVEEVLRRVIFRILYSANSSVHSILRRGH